MMVRYTGFKENLTKIMERDEALIINSCRACLFLLFLKAKKEYNI